MTTAIRAMAMALLAPLILSGCLLTPGKFVSMLDIASDRSFTFTYQGEVIAVDPSDSLAKGMSDPDASEDSEKEDGADPAAVMSPIGAQDGDAGKAKDSAAKKAEREAKNRAIADALRKEAGYRKVEYRGDGLFVIDYAVSGRLTHQFVYPYNLDAEIIFPFVVIELRGGDTVRVKAPAFGSNDRPSGNIPGGPADSGAGERIDGTFTLTTDAEIVSQNNEDGAQAAPGGRKSIRWRATPLSKDAPSVVLRLRPL